MKHKQLTLFLFFICLSTTIFAQYKVTIEAIILDKETQQPIPFVNVEYKETKIKTITDAEGKFELAYLEDAIGTENIFQCTVLGYEPLSVKSSQLFRLLQNSNKIYLNPKPFISNNSDDAKGHIPEK